MGARIGEIAEICAPLMAVSQQGDDAGTTAFMTAFVAMGDRLAGLAAEDLAAGHDLSAGTKLLRAATYYLTGERMQPAGSPARKTLYAQVQQAFRDGLRLTGDPAQRIEIPYQSGLIPGLLVPGHGLHHHSGPHPLIVMINGLDSTKEMLLRVGLPATLARRGVAVLVIDQPGTGEALRLYGLTAVPEAETWASTVYDHAARLPGIDPTRIGLHGVSLGGYYAPRAVAFDPRFALGAVWGAVWGANHDRGQVQLARAARDGDRPVPHYWDHVQWVFGQPDFDSFMQLAKRMTLNGVLDRIKVPFLVTHGEKDRQIPLKYAHQTYDQLVNSPARTLKIFTDREGGVQHSSVDNSADAMDYQADWIADTFAAMVRR